MPLTQFQAQTLRLLSKNRSSESYMAGGIALNAREPMRWSADVDVFRAVEDAVMRSSDRDVQTLRQAAMVSAKTSGHRRFVERG